MEPTVNSTVNEANETFRPLGTLKSAFAPISGSILNSKIVQQEAENYKNEALNKTAERTSVYNMTVQTRQSITLLDLR